MKKMNAPSINNRSASCKCINLNKPDKPVTIAATTPKIIFNFTENALERVTLYLSKANRSIKIKGSVKKPTVNRSL